MTRSDPVQLATGRLARYVAGRGERPLFAVSVLPATSAFVTSGTHNTTTAHRAQRTFVGWHPDGAAEVTWTACGKALRWAAPVFVEYHNDFCDSCLFGQWPHVVYVHRGHDGAVLYVGQTTDLVRRTDEHRLSAPWWPEVASITWEEVDRRAALRVESIRVHELRPRHNNLRNYIA